jgi:hypothetical protein
MLSVIFTACTKKIRKMGKHKTWIGCVISFVVAFALGWFAKSKGWFSKKGGK